MLCIGVYGENSGKKTIELLSRFYAWQQQRWICIPEECSLHQFDDLYQKAKAENIDVFMMPMYECIFRWCQQRDIKLNLLLCLSRTCHKNEEKKIDILKMVTEHCMAKNSIIILNQDDKKLFPFPEPKDSMVITCGMNQKAAVTASSVLDCLDYEQIQCCVQKSIKTLTGGEVEPQEFALKVAGITEQSVSGILAAITAMMAVDMEIAEIIEIPNNQASKEKIFE